MIHMDTWIVALFQGTTRIAYTIKGDDPHHPDEIETAVAGRPGKVYQEVQDRIEAGPWSFIPDVTGPEDAYWILDCARTTAINHPGWQVETDLPPLPGGSED